ncbi:hypothetical protein AKJ49_01445, partial [candidate division MSBL1 archaeon SCGC-AAA382A03]
ERKLRKNQRLKNELDEIESNPSYEVKKGRIIGRNNRQKGVDSLIAIDMVSNPTLTLILLFPNINLLRRYF